MAYPDYLRQRARELRVMHQLTLDELVERLALPRTTVWYWIRDLPLQRPRDSSAAQLSATRAAQPKATRAMADKYRRLREAAYEQGVAEYAADGQADVPGLRGALHRRGYKRNRNCVSIANSDSAVMQLAARWLRALTTRKLHFAVQCHADQDLDELRRFWASTIGFDPAELRLQRKSTSGQLTGRTWRSEHGVLTITVNETLLRARLQAWIDLTRTAWQ